MSNRKKEKKIVLGKIKEKVRNYEEQQGRKRKEYAEQD